MMTKEQTVMLWGREDVLCQAMESFLRKKEMWRIHRIFAEQGTDYLVEQAKSIHPDVIILYLGNCAVDQGLPMRLIQNQPALKVVAFSLENNVTQVYEKNNLILHEAADLLSIIENQKFSDHLMKGGNSGTSTESFKISSAQR